MLYFNTIRRLNAHSCLSLTIAIGGKHLRTLNIAQLENSSSLPLWSYCISYLCFSYDKETNPPFLGMQPLLLNLWKLYGLLIAVQLVIKGY